MASIFRSSISRPILNYSAATDKGLSRKNNEDNLLSIPEKGLWLVADGMGGHDAGEVASAIVRDTVKDDIRDGKNLTDTIQRAHSKVLKAVKDGVGAAGMGSTVVAVQSRGQEYEVAWVGDSRAYLWSNKCDGGFLEQLTTDHSYVQMLLSSGIIAEEEANNHPDKHVITQCIGSLDVKQVKVDTVNGKWGEQQWIVLCSDGLTDEVDDKSIARLLCDAKSPKDAVNCLMQTALKNGGRDNISIQIIESPLDQHRFHSFISEWLPTITNHTIVDSILYGLAFISLALMLYWVLV